MDFIIGISQLLLIIAPFLIGRSLNNDFKNKYGVEAICQDAFIWQCIFLFLSFVSTGGSNFSWWQVLWILCTIISYVKALYQVKSHAKLLGASSDDTIKAMIAQAIYPLGVVIILIILLAMYFRSREKRRRKKKR